MKRYASFFLTRNTSESVTCTIELRDGQSAADAVTDAWHKLSATTFIERYAETTYDGQVAWEMDDYAGKPYLDDQVEEIHEE